MNIKNQLALQHELRALAESTIGTDICVRGGNYACGCNKCAQLFRELTLIVQEELDKIFHV